MTFIEEYKDYIIVIAIVIFIIIGFVGHKYNIKTKIENIGKFLKQLIFKSKGNETINRRELPIIPPAQI